MELSIHVPSCIHLAPSVSWGLGHFFSGDLHHPVESPYSQITFAVSCSPGRKLGFTVHDEGRPVAASKPGSTQLNTWQFCLFRQVMHSNEHWVLHMRSLFLKDSSHAMSNMTQKFRGVQLWGKSWPLRNRRWERADSLVYSPSHPQLFQGAAVPCGLPGYVPSYAFPWSCASSILPHVVFAFLVSLPHFLAFLTPVTIDCTLPLSQALRSKLYLSLCVLGNMDFDRYIVILE